MGLKYEVHTGECVFIIGDAPTMRALPVGFLALRVEDEGEMHRVRQLLLKQPALKGIHVFGPDPEQLWAWFKAGYRWVDAAGGAVSDPAGRLLAIHRLGRWDLPKGKVEPGEDFATAVLREVTEECGLHRLRLLRPLVKTLHTYPRNGEQHLKCTHWFLMESDATEALVPQTEEDIDQVRWIDAAGVEAMRSDTYPSLIKVLDAWQAWRHGDAAPGSAASSGP